MQSGLTPIRYRAAQGCLFVRGRHCFRTDKENSVEGSRSKVDYVLLVEDIESALCDTKSPSVIHDVGQVTAARHRVKVVLWSVFHTELG